MAKRHPRRESVGSSCIPRMSIWPFLWARWYQIFGAIPIRLVLQIVDTSDKCSSFLGVASYLQMSKTWHVLLTMWGPVRSSLSTFIYHNSWSLVDPEGTTHGHLSPLDTTGHLEHSLPCRTCRLLGMEKLENRIFFTTQELGCYQEKNSDATLRKFGATPIYTQPKERNSTWFDPN